MWNDSLLDLAEPFLFRSENVKRELLPAAVDSTQGSPRKPRVNECKWAVTVQLIAVQQNTKPQCPSQLLLGGNTAAKTGHVLSP